MDVQPAGVQSVHFGVGSKKRSQRQHHTSVGLLTWVCQHHTGDSCGGSRGKCCLGSGSLQRPVSLQSSTGNNFHSSLSKSRMEDKKTEYNFVWVWYNTDKNGQQQSVMPC
jgi:hypothetical protein